MHSDVIAAGIVDRLIAGDAPPPPAVKAMPESTGFGSFGWGWPDRTSVSTYDYARFHRLDSNAIIVLARGWICDHVGQGEILVGRKEKGRKYTPVDSHPVSDLLARPNPWESWEETLGATVVDLIFGNAYWLLPDPSELAEPEIYWLPAALVDVVPETDMVVQRQTGPVRAYRYGRTAYPPARILHFRDRMLDPARRWMGQNRIAAQIGSAAAVDLLLRFTVASLRNGHAGKVLAPKDSLGGAVLPGSPDEAAMLTLVNRIESSVTGENVGRIVPSSVPIDLMDVGRGPEEMTLDRIGDLPIALILASMGLNMLALDLPGSAAVSTFANKAEAHKHALEYGVIPREDLVAAKIASGLLPLFPDPPVDVCWWDRKDVEALKENANERATRAVTLAPIASINERRAMVDLPPVEGGDQTPVEQEAQDAVMRQIIAGRQPVPEPDANAERNPFSTNGSRD